MVKVFRNIIMRIFPFSKRPPVKSLNLDFKWITQVIFKSRKVPQKTSNLMK